MPVLVIRFKVDQIVSGTAGEYHWGRRDQFSCLPFFLETNIEKLNNSGCVSQ